jgi:hypothetical protein
MIRSSMAPASVCLRQATVITGRLMVRLLHQEFNFVIVSSIATLVRSSFHFIQRLRQGLQPAILHLEQLFLNIPPFIYIHPPSHAKLW